MKNVYAWNVDIYYIIVQLIKKLNASNVILKN